jgi:hypothetical protein
LKWFSDVRFSNGSQKSHGRSSDVEATELQSVLQSTLAWRGVASHQSPPFYLGIFLLDCSSRYTAALFYPTTTKKTLWFFFPFNFHPFFSAAFVCCFAMLDPMVTKTRRVHRPVTGPELQTLGAVTGWKDMNLNKNSSNSELFKPVTGFRWDVVYFSETGFCHGWTSIMSLSAGVVSPSQLCGLGYLGGDVEPLPLLLLPLAVAACTSFRICRSSSAPRRDVWSSRSSAQSSALLKISMQVRCAAAILLDFAMAPLQKMIPDVQFHLQLQICTQISGNSTLMLYTGGLFLEMLDTQNPISHAVALPDYDNRHFCFHIRKNRIWPFGKMLSCRRAGWHFNLLINPKH